MLIYKITEDKRDELTKDGIVICTFSKDGLEFDGIVEKLYDFEEIELPNDEA